MNKLTKFAFVALIFFAVSTTMQASRRLPGRRRGVIYHVPLSRWEHLSWRLHDCLFQGDS